MAFRGVGLGNNGATNTVQLTCTYTIPVGVVAGDILYVTASNNFNTDTATIANTGTGIAWTVASGPDHDADGTICYYLFEGVALSGSAGQTVTVTWTSSAGRCMGILIAVSGDTLTGRTIGSTPYAGSSAVSFGAVTAVAGADVIAIAIMRGAFTTAPTLTTPPAGFTLEGESKSAYSTAAEFTHTAFLKASVTAGSITPGTVNANETVDGRSYTIQVPPSSINKLKIGVSTPNLAVGVNAASAAYLGTSQVWP